MWRHPDLHCNRDRSWHSAVLLEDTHAEQNQALVTMHWSLGTSSQLWCPKRWNFKRILRALPGSEYLSTPHQTYTALSNIRCKRTHTTPGLSLFVISSSFRGRMTHWNYIIATFAQVFINRVNRAVAVPQHLRIKHSQVRISLTATLGLICFAHLASRPGLRNWYTQIFSISLSAIAQVFF